MDPDLRRLLKTDPRQDLAVQDVAGILKIHEATVKRLVERGVIEAKRHQGRGNGKRLAIRISHEAVLVYLVKICTGDRAALFHSIKSYCPQWLELAQKAAGLHTHEAKPATAQAPLKKVSKPTEDPLQGHMGDLFSPRTIS